MRVRIALVAALCGGCFTDSEPLTTATEGTSNGLPTSSGTTAGGTTTMGASGSDDGSMTGTSADGTTTASSTGPATTGPGICDDGQECAPIPAGWEGPFSPELGNPGQCDDTSIAAAYVGTTPIYDADCSCNCAGQSAVRCEMDFLVGGAPGSCADNDMVGDHCEFILPAGPITCDTSPGGCFDTAGEQVSARAEQVCTPGVSNELTASWSSGFRMCNADDDVGTACDGGQCVDAVAPLCIYVQGDRADECPAAFPNRLFGHQALTPQRVSCDCRCTDPAECAYPTWHESGVCTGAGGDDDPVCSPAAGAVEFLPFVQAPQGCQAEADPIEPDFPLVDPITACCNVPL